MEVPYLCEQVYHKCSLLMRVSQKTYLGMPQGREEELRQVSDIAFLMAQFPQFCRIHFAELCDSRIGVDFEKLAG